jgi:putative pyruvate formate lyase activating enzyme
MNDPVFPELASCLICPHECGVDRYTTTGFCNSKATLRYNLHQRHYGEEPVLSGTKGSGTIFFSNCNLACVYCQNYQISQNGRGTEISIERLVEIMFELQDTGVHNINFVSPTHYTPQIREAIIRAKQHGLKLPIVWNSNSYEKCETLKTLDGLVDIYLPDFKYTSAIYSKLYSSAPGYPEYALAAMKEMFHQVGHLRIQDGIAVRGMLVRLLVLPKDVSGVSKSLYTLYEEFGSELYLSLMGQYYPTYKAENMPPLDKRLEPLLYNKMIDISLELGFENAYIQECGSSKDWTPRFRDNSDGER